MKNLCRFHTDLELVEKSITEATSNLRTSMPDEIVALALLHITRGLLRDLTELGQWDILQVPLIDLWRDFDEFVHYELALDWDPDRYVENYNKRHG